MGNYIFDNSRHSFCRFRGVLVSFAHFCCVFTFMLFTASALTAQTTSTIEGVVKDNQGLAVAGAQVQVANTDLGIDRTVTTDSDGTYSVAGLPPGHYELRVAKDGFQSQVSKGIEITLNKTLTFDVAMKVGTVNQTVEVDSSIPLLDPTVSSTGTTITPQQIEDMPINGRNYLDLLQLVPGVSLNRQSDPAGDNATPILGDRGGNTLYLIDGLPNRDNFNGGPSAQFNQDSILEFQVITGGYKAEFGHASGGVVNVVTRSGTNQWHGGGSAYYRSSAFDANDIPGSSAGAPFLNRWDPTLYVGGPVWHDKVFFFGSAERILESRQLNFVFDPTLPPSLINFEAPFNQHSQTRDTRARARIDENFGSHRLSEQLNYTNSHITDYLPLLASNSLPDTRQNLSGRTLMLGFNDLWTIGSGSDAWMVNSYFQYRADPSQTAPSHPDSGVPNNLFNRFDTYDSGDLFGNLGQVSFGPGYNAFSFYQKYISLGSNISRLIGRHNIKFGWDYQNTKVDGAEPNNFFTQLFATEADFTEFGPIDSGVNLITLQAGPTPADNLVRIRNNYNGLFVQDDYRIAPKITLNVGLRWDYDTRFPNKTDFSPRVGVAWNIAPKTVVNASFGIFYDQFRAGVARDVPDLGGANIQRVRLLSFPRLFYGDPTNIGRNFQGRGRPTVCLSNTLTDAEIATQGTQCINPLTTPPSNLHTTIYGIDHLNNVVASGHAAIPANAVVDINNIQQLSGYTPDEFLAAANASVANAAGTNEDLVFPADYWSWDPFGHLTTIGGILGTAGAVPVTVDPNFKVPYTRNYHVGVQQGVGNDFVFTADYYHKDIIDVLTVRTTNLEFDARMPDTPGRLIPGTGNKTVSFGPWGAGTYDGFTLGMQKRMSHHFTIQANYTFAHAIDNVLNSTLTSEIQTGQGVNFLANAGLSDSYVGLVPLVTDSDGRTNANGAFINSIGNAVPKAGTFYNGANIDKGPSDLALNHTFLAHGIVQLPWTIEISGIFRAQSGFHYTKGPADGGSDFDGDGLFNGEGLSFAGQNLDLAHNFYTAPSYFNVDMRIAKKFKIGERVSAQALFEFFNIFNKGNTAAVQGLDGTDPAFGTTTQRLPGREGQIGLRIEF